MRDVISSLISSLFFYSFGGSGDDQQTQYNTNGPHCWSLLLDLCMLATEVTDFMSSLPNDGVQDWKPPLMLVHHLSNKYTFQYPQSFFRSSPPTDKFFKIQHFLSDAFPKYFKNVLKFLTFPLAFILWTLFVPPRVVWSGIGLKVKMIVAKIGVQKTCWS